MEFINCFATAAETISQWGFSEGFSTIMSEIKNPTFIGWLVKALFDAIGNYGWAVVLFTVILKVLTSPLDFWQRFSMKKNAKVMGEMSELMANLDKAYANDKAKLNREKSKLSKKYGYSMLAGCLPMIVTMVIFFIMFGGLNQCSAFVNLNVYRDLSVHYTETLAAELLKHQADFESNRYDILMSGEGSVVEDYKSWLASTGVEATDLDARYEAATADIKKIREYAQAAARYSVGEYFDEAREGFLWITNLSRPDTSAEAFPQSVDKFTGSLTKRYRGYKDEINSDLYTELFKGVNEQGVGYKVGQKYWNGLFILPVLAVGLSFLSTFISNKTNKNKSAQTGDPNAAGAQSTNKVMMFVMPIMMGVFGFIYTATFALYMVCSSILSILFTLAMNPIIDSRVRKIKPRVEKPDYRRK